LQLGHFTGIRNLLSDVEPLVSEPNVPAGEGRMSARRDHGKGDGGRSTPHLLPAVSNEEVDGRRWRAH
jgi:hypothetical protein